MKTVQEYEIIIRLTKENYCHGAAAETVSGGLLESVPPLSAAGSDALYALLHALALKNNFSGCLKEAERQESRRILKPKSKKNETDRAAILFLGYECWRIQCLSHCQEFGKTDFYQPC